ncbi:MAG: MtrB/PioB family outer membrane beta-barrel protein [Thermodesulfobacteriota bacterium]|jgi:opacity protein-like surface antigen|nr:MAG: MtrB/PioB family outer membrane beta-barrel protein [Thermodesulfobacteriota bacterium]
MKVKIKREFLVFFLAVMFITLTCRGGIAEMDAGNYTLGGYISLGGGFLADPPLHRNAGFLEKYIPFPEGFLAETDLSLKSKDGLEYYRFWMSHPGLRDQDFLLQAGKLGVYHSEIEYDSLQHLYSTVNPFDTSIRTLVQRLRFSGYYNPTLNITLFAENDFLKRTGSQPGTYITGPGNPLNFFTYIRPIDDKQNDLKVGVEYDQPVVFQGRVSYHFSNFDNENDLVLGRQNTTNSFVALPPSNKANYVTGEGSLNLLAYKTRLTGSFSYGWLSENDLVIDRNGVTIGDPGLDDSTVNANISGVTRLWPPLTLRYSYNYYDFSNDSTMNQLLETAFGENQALFKAEHYSYLRQGVNLGADYKVNQKMAFTVGYSWKGVSRKHELGSTSSHSPQTGLRWSPTNWLSLNANYAFTDREGHNNVAFVNPTGEATQVPLTYKFYAGNLIRNNANFIAEVYPLNNVTFSLNFSIYNDNFTDSDFGIQRDRGWSAGADVSWSPHDRVALSLGYDHQQLRVKQLAATFLINDEPGLVGGDEGPTLITSDSFDTVVARADIKLIPNKLSLKTSASYSHSTSDFHNPVMPNLNESYADVDTWFNYRFNDHWDVGAGYIFQMFRISSAYERLFLRGITAAGAPGNDQSLNTLGGFYPDATAHVVQGFLQYRF